MTLSVPFFERFDRLNDVPHDAVKLGKREATNFTFILLCFLFDWRLLQWPATRLPTVEFNQLVDGLDTIVAIVLHELHIDLA